MSLRTGGLLIVALLVSASASAQTYRVTLAVQAFYTNDEESGGEEWTIKSRAYISGLGFTNEKIWTLNGDSNPNWLAYRNVKDYIILDRTLSTVPKFIYYEQSSWEDDRGSRTEFNCCGVGNDDDHYHTGAVHVLLPCDLPIDETFHYPVLPGSPRGRTGVRLRVQVSEVR